MSRKRQRTTHGMYIPKFQYQYLQACHLHARKINDLATDGFLKVFQELFLTWLSRSDYTVDMEVLRVSRRILTTMAICSLPNGNASRLKVLQLAVAILILVIFILGGWYSALYCFEHYQIADMSQNLFALIQFVGSVPTIGSFISLICRRTNVRDYFDKIQTIFNKCIWKLDLIPFEWIIRNVF